MFDLAAKNLREFLRDKKLLITLLISPFLLLLIHAFSGASQKFFSSIPLAVVNPEPEYPKAGKLFVMALQRLKLPTASAPLVAVKVVDSQTALAFLHQEKVTGVLIIPRHFTRGLNEGKQSQKMVLILNSGDERAQLLRFELQAFVRQMGFFIEKSKGKEATQPVWLSVVAGAASSSTTEIQLYGMFILFSFVFFIVFAAGQWIREFELGSFFRFRLARIAPFPLFAGSFLSILFLGLIESALLVLATFLTGLRPYLLVLWIGPVVFVLMLATHGLGLLISSFIEKEKQLNALSPFIMLPLVFLAGPMGEEMAGKGLLSFIPWYQGYRILLDVMSFKPVDVGAWGKMILASLVLAVAGTFVFSAKRLRYG